MASKVDSNRKRAGVIPYIVEDGTIKMMFMQATKNPDAGWQIAKGGIEKNETKREAALREASEELGLFEPNCGDIKSIGSFGGISLYIAEVLNLDLFGDPMVEEVVDTTWLSAEEFNESGRMCQKHIVKQAFAIISKVVDQDVK